MRRASSQVVEVVKPVVEGLGYEFVGAEFGQAENGQTLRIYIDQPAGILIDDCVAVSHQVSAVLDVEDTIASAYQLEVSSPGVDRPLFTPAHFEREVGKIIRVRMLEGVDGRRNFKGRLVSVDASAAVVEVDGIDYGLPLVDMENAQLVGVLPRDRNKKRT